MIISLIWRSNARAHHPHAVFDGFGGVEYILVERQLAGLDLRQIEDIVDDLKQVVPTIVNIARVFPVTLVFDRAEPFVPHDLGEPDDGVERRPQLVAHICQELALGTIGHLCRFLGLAQRILRLPALSDIAAHAHEPPRAMDRHRGNRQFYGKGGSILAHRC